MRRLYKGNRALVAYSSAAIGPQSLLAYVSVGGLASVFVFRIACNWRKYSAPRCAVFFPPIRPDSFTITDFEIVFPQCGHFVPTMYCKACCKQNGF